MSIYFKKSIVFGCALAAAITLSACGDDSSSNPSSNNDNPSSSSTGDTTINSSDDGTGNGTGSDKISGNGGAGAPNGGSSTSNDNTEPLPAGFEGGVRLNYDMTLDESTKSFTLTPADQANMACIVKGDQVEWKSVSPNPVTQTFMYDFVGDTLVLYSWDSDDEDFYPDGAMYVGGTAGSILGTWKYTPCSYNKTLDQVECYSNDSFDGMLIFTENSAESIQKNLSSNLNYSKSEFREELLTALDEGYSWFPSVEELYYTAAREGNATYANIDVSYVTKKGESFKYNGTTYTVTVPEYTDVGNSYVIAVEIESDVKKCTGIYEISALVTKDLCKEENLDYFETESFKDASGNYLHYASYYEHENSSEFRECLTDLFGMTDDHEIIYDDYPPLYKKAAKKNSKKRQNIFMNLF